MGPLLIPLIAGLLGAGGAVASSAITNNAQKKAARDQMAFQERMSSTAAERSVLDYTRAGLNPGLAYERSASSPGGAMANVGMEDAISKGLSSAQSAAALIQQLNLQKLETQERIALMKGQQEQARTSAAYDWERALSERVNRNFSVTQQPHMNRINLANAIVGELQGIITGHQIPGAKNTADFERSIGQLKGWMGGAKTLSEILKNFKR